jgi:DNA-binding GntR family transcriptional regulator
MPRTTRSRATRAPGRAPGARPAQALPDARIYDRIHAAIIEQRLPPGTKLGEQALSSLFGASRARIRQVLLALSHGGMVERHRNRGAYVTQLSTREAREVFTARRLVEAHIVECVAKGLTGAQRGRLERHVRAEHVAARGGERSAVIRLSGDFHVLLAEIAGNDVLTRFLRDLVSRTSLVVALYEGRAASCEASEHQPFLHELVAGRAREAGDRMVRHLERIEARLDLDREIGHAVDLAAILGPGGGGRGRTRPGA